MSSDRAFSGASISRSRFRAIQRVSVDRPTPRFSANSRRVRPLVRARRTASSSNSCVNPFCFVIEFTFHPRKTLHSSRQVHFSLSWYWHFVNTSIKMTGVGLGNRLKIPHGDFTESLAIVLPIPVSHGRWRAQPSPRRQAAKVWPQYCLVILAWFSPSLPLTGRAERVMRPGQG